MRWLLISFLIVISFNAAGQQYYETYTPAKDGDEKLVVSN